MATSDLELDDIQGILLFAYASLAHAAYVHVTFPAAAGTKPNAWLGKIAKDIAASNVHHGKRGDKINVAFTAEGLARLGVSKKEIESFPRELQQGMGHDLRAHVLGDDAENHPDTWEVGGPKNEPLHALLLLYSHEPDTLEKLREREVGRLSDHGGAVVHVDLGHVRGKEHFGFADGIEQPHIAGSPRRKEAHQVEIPAGEFILGYANAYGEMPPSPRGGDGFDIGKNGTYLVYRKLRQHVGRFWEAMLTQAEHDEKRASLYAARIIGRWPSGAPLVRHPLEDVKHGETYDPAFDFDKLDRDGSRCPFGAHIRRANPRNMLPPDPQASMKAVQRHRLLRRGRPYGPPVAAHSPEGRAKDDGVDRGLVFLVLNASIRRQFEFVQQTWLNNPKFAGLYHERDPLVATAKDDDDPRADLTMQGTPVRGKLAGLPRFVTNRGGGYFFLPGKKAIAWLAARKR